MAEYGGLLAETLREVLSAMTLAAQNANIEYRPERSNETPPLLSRGRRWYSQPERRRYIVKKSPHSNQENLKAHRSQLAEIFTAHHKALPPCRGFFVSRVVRSKPVAAT